MDRLGTSYYKPLFEEVAADLGLTLEDIVKTAYVGKLRDLVAEIAMHRVEWALMQTIYSEVPGQAKHNQYNSGPKPVWKVRQ